MKLRLFGKLSLMLSILGSALPGKAQAQEHFKPGYESSGSDSDPDRWGRQSPTLSDIDTDVGPMPDSDPEAISSASDHLSEDEMREAAAPEHPLEAEIREDSTTDHSSESEDSDGSATEYDGLDAATDVDLPASDPQHPQGHKRHYEDIDPRGFFIDKNSFLMPPRKTLKRREESSPHPVSSVKQNQSLASGSLEDEATESDTDHERIREPDTDVDHPAPDSKNFKGPKRSYEGTTIDPRQPFINERSFRKPSPRKDSSSPSSLAPEMMSSDIWEGDTEFDGWGGTTDVDEPLEERQERAPLKIVPNERPSFAEEEAFFREELEKSLTPSQSRNRRNNQSEKSGEIGDKPEKQNTVRKT